MADLLSGPIESSPREQPAHFILLPTESDSSVGVAAVPDSPGTIRVRVAGGEDPVTCWIWEGSE